MKGPVPVLPGKRPASAGQAIYAIGVVVLLVLLVLVTYTGLHEGGHALAGLLFGGTVTQINLNFLNLSAHVGIEGAFTPLQDCIITVAGVLVPLLVWATGLALAPRQSNMVVDSLKLITALAVLNTLLAWIGIPLLYAAGTKPGDDSTNFLTYSTLPPVVVTGAALLIYAGGWAFYFRNTGGLPALRNLVLRLRCHTGEFVAPAATRSLGIVLLCGAVVAVSSWGLSAYLAAANPLGLPPGYVPVATINLDERSYAGDSVYRFTLPQPATAGLYILLQDVRSGPLDLSLVGPGAYRNTFFKAGAESSGAPGLGRATVHPEGLLLPRGDYTLQLTAPQGPGRIVVATRITGAGEPAGGPAGK